MKRLFELSGMLTAGLLLVLSTAVFAQKQELKCNDAESITAHVSEHGLTRLSIEGDRLSKVIGLDENVNVIKDEAHGHMFLKGITGKQSITIVTEGGDLQDLTLVPDVKGSASIVLIPQSKPTKKESQITPLPLTTNFDRAISGQQALSSQEMMLALIKQLYMGLGTASETGTKRTSATGMEASSIRILTSNGLVGEVFRVTNTESNTTILLEKDFYHAGDLAIALGQKQLNAGESTLLFVVKAPQG